MNVFVWLCWWRMFMFCNRNVMLPCLVGWYCLIFLSVLFVILIQHLSNRHNQSSSIRWTDWISCYNFLVFITLIKDFKNDKGKPIICMYDHMKNHHKSSMRNYAFLPYLSYQNIPRNETQHQCHKILIKNTKMKIKTLKNIIVYLTMMVNARYIQ